MSVTFLLYYSVKRNLAKMGDHKLDIAKTIAERIAREKEKEREKELGLSEDTSQSLSLQLSDSIFYFDSSQNSTPMEAPKSKLDRLAELNIFDRNQVFRLFKKKDVNISFIDGKKSSVKDIPKMKTQQLIDYLSGYLNTSLQKATDSGNHRFCRYLFYLMSVSKNKNVVAKCDEILRERIGCASTPFSILISDLVTVLANYGTVKRKLWPSGKDFVLGSTVVEKRLLADFEEPNFSSPPFPRENLLAVLKLFQINVHKYPHFSDTHKVGLFHMMLNLLMANNIMNDTSMAVVIRKILKGILLSFSDEEWSNMNYRKVEDLAEVSIHDDLAKDYVGMVQRIKCIPVDTERGIQVQRSAAHMAFQEMLDFNTVHLSGFITIDDVIWMINETIKASNQDMILIYCVVKLIEICVDLEKADKEKLKEAMRLLKEWRHSIPDVNKDLDYNRLTVKDLMTELEVIWKDEISISDFSRIITVV